MKAPARSTATAGARRGPRACALALACSARRCAGARAVRRHAGHRQRQPLSRHGHRRRRAGAARQRDGRLGARARTPASRALWRTRDAGLASADAMAGWSGRLNELPGLAALAPDWGWDAAVHRTHYGEGARYDFSEAMLGLLAPDWTLRTLVRAALLRRRHAHALHRARREPRVRRRAGTRSPTWAGCTTAGGPHYQARMPDRADTLVGIGATLSAGTSGSRATASSPATRAATSTRAAAARPGSSAPASRSDSGDRVKRSGSRMNRAVSSSASTCRRCNPRRIQYPGAETMSTSTSPAPCPSPSRSSPARCSPPAAAAAAAAPPTPADRRQRRPELHHRHLRHDARARPPAPRSAAPAAATTWPTRW